GSARSARLNQRPPRVPRPRRTAVPERVWSRDLPTGRVWSGGEGLEGDRAQVMPRGEVDGGVEGGGQPSEQGNGRLSAAFLDALDVILGHRGPCGEFGDGQAEFGADVVQGFAEGEGLA